MDQKQRQLQLSDTELDRIKDRVWHDFLAARSNHDARIARFRRYYRLWRGLPQAATDAVSDKDQGDSFEVPMLKWITFGHWSRCMAALLGDDAEVVSKPIAPEDEKLAPKVGAYETWRLFEYMRAISGLTAWMFRSVLFGRAHAYVPYEQEYYWERDEQGNDTEKLSYDGPKLIPLWFDQIIVPAQDVETIDDFEWIIRRVRVTPQQLLDGERHGKYFGIRDNWEQIYAHSQQRQERDYWWDDARVESDLAEGVSHASLMGNRDSIEVWQWYGKWRLPKGKQDARPENLKRRQPTESELLVTYLPKPGIVIGVQDLRDLYPRMRKRRPFVDIGLVKDGSYWCPGLGELVESIQDKSSANYRLFEQAGRLSVGPIIIYRPSSGFDPDAFEYKPGMAIPSEDPAGVQTVRLQADLKFAEENQQALASFAERVTGVSDQTLGQAIDRPNAPRTATGQMALIEQGNVRASLDMSMLREDLSVLLSYLWALDREYAPESVFFRATEEDANGLFDVNNGFGTMTAQEREHNFDFELKFATSVWSKEAKKQYILQLYTLSVQNPIIMTNPRALWVLLNRVWKAFGEDNFRDVIPEPPQPDQPQTPKTEWAELLKGEEIHVNPLDDDQQHLVDHLRRLERDRQQPEEDQDPQAQAAMVAHVLEHESQQRHKMLLAAAVQQIQQQLQAQQGQPGAMPAPAVAPSSPAGPAGPGAGAVQPQPPVAGGPGGAPSPADVAQKAGPGGLGAPVGPQA